MPRPKKRGRKPGVKVGPYKRDFNLNEYLSTATLRATIKDIEIAIQKLNEKSKTIMKHLNTMKGL